MDLVRLNELLNAFGNEVGVEGFALDENGYAYFVSDTTVVINFDFYREENALVLSATVAPIEDDNRMIIYEELLQGAFFWGDNRGATMALSPDGNHAMMLYPVDLNNASVPGLVAAYNIVCEHSWAWAKRLATATGRVHFDPPDTMSDADRSTPDTEAEDASHINAPGRFA